MTLSVITEVTEATSTWRLIVNGEVSETVPISFCAVMQSW